MSVIAQGRLFDGEGRDHPLFPPRTPDLVFHGWIDRAAQRLSWGQGSLPAVGRWVAAQVMAARRVAPIELIEMEESFGWCEIVRRRARIPVVTRLHGPHFLKPARPRTRAELHNDRQRCAAEGRALRKAHSLTAPTRAVLEATRRHYGIGTDWPSAVIPNPIPLPCEKLRWKLERCNQNQILMVGRFDYWKGADTMLAAFAQLLAWRPRAQLTLVGPDLGIEVAPGRLVAFEEYARASLSPSVRDRVRFTGTLRPDQIIQLRRDAFVTVLASRLENFPYALLEGLAMGCPMISTAWPGSEEIIVDGTSGLLTPVGDPGALATRLDWLMSQPHEACRLAGNGLQRCKDHYSVQAVGAEMLRYYRATLRAPAP